MLDLEIFENVEISTVTGPAMIQLCMVSDDLESLNACHEHHKLKYRHCLEGIHASRKLIDGRPYWTRRFVINRFLMEGSS